MSLDIVLGLTQSREENLADFALLTIPQVLIFSLEVLHGRHIVEGELTLSTQL